MSTRAQILRARELRRNATPAERAVWRLLRGPDFRPFHFRRQAPVGPYFADFISHKARLLIEVDGDTHGGRRDQVRDAWFAGEGYRTLRIWNSEVHESLEGVARRVWMVLEEQGVSDPHLDPPQNGEGEPHLGPPKNREGEQPSRPSSR